MYVTYLVAGTKGMIPQKTWSFIEAMVALSV